jgi:hypothetical protein
VTSFRYSRRGASWTTPSMNCSRPSASSRQSGIASGCCSTAAERSWRRPGKPHWHARETARRGAQPPSRGGSRVRRVWCSCFHFGLLVGVRLFTIISHNKTLFSRASRLASTARHIVFWFIAHVRPPEYVKPSERDEMNAVFIWLSSFHAVILSSRHGVLCKLCFQLLGALQHVPS